MGDLVGNKGGFHPCRYRVPSPASWDTLVLQLYGWHPPLRSVDPKVWESLRINHCPLPLLRGFKLCEVGWDVTVMSFIYGPDQNLPT